MEWIRKCDVLTGVPLDLVLGFAIGLSLGLLGGGGSILTVPALVYLVGQSPQAAVTTSLAIVGGNSLLGAAFHSGQGTLNWKVAAIFGGAGMITAYAAAGLSKHFSPAALLVAFAVLMLVVAGADAAAPRPRRRSGSGAALVGDAAGRRRRRAADRHPRASGGGFLIVPALVMLVGLPMYQAVGTSLIIIAANSAAGLLGHLDQGLFDLSLTLVFVAAGLAGTFVGSRLAHRLPAARLKQAFAVFVIVLAVFLLKDNLPKLIV